MTLDRLIVAGLVAGILLDVGFIVWLSRRPRVRRGGYINRR